MKSTFQKYALAIPAALTLGAGSLLATPTTAEQVTAISTSASTLLTAIYPIVIGAVAFGVLIAIVKMVKKR